LSILFFSLFAFFLFYELNYRTLIIRLNKYALQLKFGIFTWIIPLHNIETCFLDTTSLWRIGGEGIHYKNSSYNDELVEGISLGQC